MAAATVEPPKGEHIFPNTELTEKVLRWKALTSSAIELKSEVAKLDAEATEAVRDGREVEAAELREAIEAKEAEAQDKQSDAFALLEEVIIKSEPMFERLAQYEGFHLTVPLPQLVQAARQKVPHWMLKCEIEKLHDGQLFSFFSTCAKNAFRSELAKHRQFTTRYHVTGDNLEKYVGSEDHAVDRHDAAGEVQRRLTTISTRWGDPAEMGAVRFCVDCISDLDRQPFNKQTITNGARFAYGLSEEQARFFYQWALFAMRDALLDNKSARFTKQDILRHRESYTFLPDVIDIVGWDKFVVLVKTMGGQRLKIPTEAQLNRQHADWLMQRDMMQTDGTPQENEEVAKKHGRSARQASELFAELSESMAKNKVGEHALYGSEDEHGHTL